MNRAELAQHLGRKPRKDAEEQLHLALVEHLRWRANKRVIWWHTPNELVRSEAQAKKFKAMGGLAGVYDFTFLVPREFGVPSDRFTVAVPCVLEIKIDGGLLSKDQLQFGADCDALGIENAVAWNIDQALSILAAWGVLPQGT